MLTSPTDGGIKAWIASGRPTDGWRSRPVIPRRARERAQRCGQPATSRPWRR